MYIEYSKTGKEVKRYDSFSARKVKALYKKHGKESVNTFLDHLDRYGEARLRSLDPAAEDNGVLFRKVDDSGSARSGTGTTDGAPANSGTAGNTGTGSGMGSGNSASSAV